MALALAIRLAVVVSVTMSGYDVIPDYGDPRLLPNPMVPGAKGVEVLGGLLRGSVATCLLYVAQRFHATVEPLIQSHGQWGYEPRKIAGSGSWSNHAAGAAMDLNAALHPSGAAGTFTPRQLAVISGIRASVASAIEWGGAWSPSSLDAMHWQVRNGAAGMPVDRLAAQILGGPPAAGAPPAAGHPYPFVRGDGRYFGPFSGPAKSISGSGPGDGEFHRSLALWQSQAAARGFGPCLPDGFYGPQTAATARRVQVAHNLSVDGLIGWDTWNAVWR